MPKDFFSTLQPHSAAKLDIVEKYIIPWMRKIILGRRIYSEDARCLVIDGFAGSGKYDDGAFGSPLRFLQSAVEFCEQSREKGWKDPEIYLILIEGDARIYSKLVNNLNQHFGYPLDADGFARLPSYPSINVVCINDTFKDALRDILDSVSNLIPSFCFIDPFGFKDTPFELIRKYMHNNRAEMLLNLIYEETNRFATHKDLKVQQHLKDLFGISSIDELVCELEGCTAKQRKQVMVDLYGSQLREEARVKHVLSFEIMKQGRTKMILFYGTNSIDGLRLMKDVMWKVDDTGSYLFDDRKNPYEIEFSFISDVDDSILINQLTEQIFDKFKGRKNISEKDVDHFVLTETRFPVTNYSRNALKLLEADQRITSVRKMDGSQRKKGTFKDVYITFRN